jgi:large subunit ribosomal protein L3
VFKGRKMPGQMGNNRDTQQALRVVKVDIERHLIMVKGSVPGAPNSYVTIRPAVRG